MLGDDLMWSGIDWKPKIQSRSKAIDPDKLRINSYRVLLSRGRDGMIIFLPNEFKFDASHRALLDSGSKPLEPNLDKKDY